jgi:hypothetical protein
MSNQYLLPGIPPPTEATKTQPKKRPYTGRAGVAQVQHELALREVDTMPAPELRPYDLAAEIKDSFGYGLVAKIQVKTQEQLTGPFGFHKGNGKMYAPGDFHIAACGLLSTNSTIYSFGIPKNALRYRVEDFQNAAFCRASWDIAIQDFVSHLSEALAA